MKQSKFYQIKNIAEHEYTLVSCDGSVITRPIQDVDKSASTFTIEDAKDGDLIYVSTEEKGIQAIFREYKNKTIFFHCYLCGDFVQDGYMPIGDVELVYPLQKTHYKRFFEKMHEAGYEWDDENKELKKIEQNPAWSEEDEKMMKLVIEDIHCGTNFNAEVIREANKRETWLNSLKERYTWKPSDEQMKQLGWVAEQNKNNMIGKELMTLYQDLKKAKGE